MCLVKYHGMKQKTHSHYLADYSKLNIASMKWKQTIAFGIALTMGQEQKSRYSLRFHFLSRANM